MLSPKLWLLPKLVLKSNFLLFCYCILLLITYDIYIFPLLLLFPKLWFGVLLLKILLNWLLLLLFWLLLKLLLNCLFLLYFVCQYIYLFFGFLSLINNWIILYLEITISTIFAIHFIWTNTNFIWITFLKKYILTKLNQPLADI